jgi:hypothetical protein
MDKRFQGTVRVKGNSDVTFERCFFGDAGEGLNVSGNARVRMVNCYVGSCSDLGIECNEQATVNMESCVLEKCGRRGIYVLRAATVNATLCTIRGNGAAFSSNMDSGWESDNAALRITNCSIEGNGELWMDGDHPGTIKGLHKCQIR